MSDIWNSLLFRNGAHPGEVEPAAMSPEAMGVVEGSPRYAGQIGWVTEKTEVILPGVTASHCTFIHLGRCDTCNTLHEIEAACPYCAGHEDGAAEADISRRALEFATTQQLMLCGQLGKRDDIIAALQKDHAQTLDECADLRRQLDLARLDRSWAEAKLAWEHGLRMAAYEREAATRKLHTAARSLLRKAALTLVALGAAAALTWATWDRLPGLARYWRGAAEVVALLGVSLLVLPRWRHSGTSDYFPRPGELVGKIHLYPADQQELTRAQGDECRAAGLETLRPPEVTKPAAQSPGPPAEQNSV